MTLTRDKAGVLAMLRASGDQQQELFAKACRVRNEHFGERVIVRGVIEITNRCRVNCDYCPMRRDNQNTNTSYMMEPDEVVAAAEPIKRQGIDAVLLQGGEIPHTTAIAARALPGIKHMFGNAVEVLLCLGRKEKEDYRLLKEAGATGYIIKHETCDPELHARLRHQELTGRLQCIADLLSLGHRVGTGTIVGLPGQPLESLADDILLARQLGVHMVSASPFMAAPNTPLEHEPTGSLDLTLNTIAAMRIVNPQYLIPSVSALQTLRQDGQLAGLNAGANVITVNFTPREQVKSYEIYGRARFVVDSDHVDGVLRAAGLERSGSVWL